MTDRTYSTSSPDPVSRERTATLTITRGLPASGKTTWVKTQIRDHQDTRARISRDYLRLGMHDAALFTSVTEEHVTLVEYAAATALLTAGVEVYVDDTNLADLYVQGWSDLAQSLWVPFRVQDFRDVPLEVCLDRDRRRFWTSGHVGEQVIRRMHAQYLAGDVAVTGE
jgi:predicted kinase